LPGRFFIVEGIDATWSICGGFRTPKADTKDLLACIKPVPAIEAERELAVVRAETGTPTPRSSQKKRSAPS
jgi:hypothetical protein